jgi:hypothetical protein
LTYLLQRQNPRISSSLVFLYFQADVRSTSPYKTRISSSLIHTYLQVNLQPTPQNKTGSAAVSYINTHRSTYPLHHQTNQSQQQPHIHVLADQLTNYNTKQTRVSSSIIYQYAKVNLQPMPPNKQGSAAVSYINTRRSTYPLHHQTNQDQ